MIGSIASYILRRATNTKKARIFGIGIPDSIQNGLASSSNEGFINGAIDCVDTAAGLIGSSWASLLAIR
jgi:hypothetical protein